MLILANVTYAKVRGCYSQIEDVMSLICEYSGVVGGCAESLVGKSCAPVLPAFFSPPPPSPLLP